MKVCIRKPETDVFIYVDLRPAKWHWILFENGELMEIVEAYKKHLDEYPIEKWGPDEHKFAAAINYPIEKKKGDVKKDVGKST